MARSSSTSRGRGSIEQRGNSLRVKVYAGTDPVTGKRLYLSESTTDEKEAEKILTRLQAEVDKQRNARTRATFGFAVDKWLQLLQVEASTREANELYIRGSASARRGMPRSPRSWIRPSTTTATSLRSRSMTRNRIRVVPACTMQDYAKSVWGPRPRSDWGPVERAIGQGFAPFLQSNEGVLYGVKALRRGEISAADFVAVNTGVGGLDLDGKIVSRRTGVDRAALAMAYRTGQVTDARQLARLPILDLRAGANTAEIHTPVHSKILRTRLRPRSDRTPTT